MTPTPRDLQDFGTEARNAVALAEVEARALGHDRIGTEHLLLGLLADQASDAARMLADVGITLEATRSKVREAVGAARGPVVPTPGALPLTPRAVRALGRSVRFCHSRHVGVVASEHLLWGVIDVEGTAGQVLRGLGLDIETIRVSLEDEQAPVAPDRIAAASNDLDDVGLSPAICPFCSTALDDQIVFSVITAFDASRDATRDALVFSCRACNKVLGVSPDPG